MDKILKGGKRIPVVIAGRDCYIDPITPRHILEMQDFVLAKRAKKIRIIYKEDPEQMYKELKALVSNDISVDKLLKSDFDILTYFLWIRCSLRDEISYDEFIGDFENLENNIDIVFGGETKNVQAEQEK